MRGRKQDQLQHDKLLETQMTFTLPTDYGHKSEDPEMLSLNGTESETSSIDMEEIFQAKHIVFIQNQYDGLTINPLLEDDFDEEDQESMKDQLLSEEDKVQYNCKIIAQIIEKVSKQIEGLKDKLHNLKETNYATTIQWAEEEFLHKEANLQVEQDMRELILLKKKKLERVRRDILMIPNLKGEECTELFLGIKAIEFNESNEIIKEFFAAIDLIVSKNSMLGFDWKQFTARVFKNKETIDSYIFKMKYYPFNDMTDYYEELCRKFSEKSSEFLELFEDQDSQKKTPFEVFLIKPLVDWMKIMRYGCELSQDLIMSIKRINSAQHEVEKIRLNLDILKERNRLSNQHKSVLTENIEFLTVQLTKLKAFKQSIQKKQSLKQ